jgi:Zn-dependent protease/CBS domain-containing protein
MKWSVRIGKAFGIPVYMHLTFLLLLAWVGWSQWAQSKSIDAALMGILFILALFACVLLHEFGHALMARRYGITTRDVTLLPIGGVARLERMPDDPKQELWVALAGPAVNVVIAVVLFFALKSAGLLESLEEMSVTGGSFLGRLLLVNVSLVLFNLIPAFPMDGGRVLRSFLAMRMEYTRATHVAAVVGQGAAFVFGLIGLFSNPFLIFIAFFVWIGAAQEASMVQMKSSLGGIPISRAMITEFHTLTPGSRLSQAIELTLTGAQKDFPVVEGDRVVGVLTQKDLLGALSKTGPGVTVGEVMQRDFEMADASEMLETAFQRLGACACHTAPVSSQGRLVGLVTMDNIGEFLAIQGALGKARA